MPSNRLLPQQFGVNLTLDGTRIEQNVRKLTDLFNDVPAGLAKRRWATQHVVGHFSPPMDPAASLGVPFMDYENVSTSPNVARVKSCKVVGIDPPFGVNTNLYTWELSLRMSRPTILACLTLVAEYNADFPNDWVYGIAPPPGFIAGQATQDFTLQACVDDGWDLENRRKLRQETLVWQTPSSAFRLTVPATLPADTLLPVRPNAFALQAHVVTAKPLVLLPQDARVRFQFTIPQYTDPTASSWGQYPWRGNVWTLHAEVLEACQ